MQNRTLLRLPYLPRFASRVHLRCGIQDQAQPFSVGLAGEHVTYLWRPVLVHRSSRGRITTLATDRMTCGPAQHQVEAIAAVP